MRLYLAEQFVEEFTETDNYIFLGIGRTGEWDSNDTVIPNSIASQPKAEKSVWDRMLGAKRENKSEDRKGATITFSTHFTIF